MPLTTPTIYLADKADLSVPAPEQRTITDAAEGGNLIRDALRRRLSGIPMADQDVIVLAGAGVDSATVAGALYEMGQPFTVVTVVTEDQPEEAEAASLIAHATGSPHLVIRLTIDDVSEYSRQAIELLEVAELWEIAAAIFVLAVKDILTDRFASHPVVLTGGAADTLFGGGTSAPADVVELDVRLRADAVHHFTRERLTPDFYERLLGELAATWHTVYQCWELWEIACRLAPEALYRTTTPHDKAAVRAACAGLVTHELAARPKAALQKSSGIHAALHAAARQAARSLPAATEYRDPINDDWEDIAARLFLEILSRRPV